MTLNSHIEALEARHEIELKISGDSGAFPFNGIIVARVVDGFINVCYERSPTPAYLYP